MVWFMKIKIGESQNMLVALNSLNNSEKVALEFMNQVLLIYHLMKNLKIFNFY